MRPSHPHLRLLSILAIIPLVLGVSSAATPGQPVRPPAKSPKAPAAPRPTPPAAPSTATPTPAKPNIPAKSANPGLVELADEAFHLDSVGLSIRLPTDTRAQATKIGDRASVQIMPTDNTWIINIQTPLTSNPNATVKEAADQTLALLQGSHGVVDPDQKNVMETQARLIDRTGHLLINQQPAERLYVTTPRTDATRLVKGYTIFKPAPKQFVVFELIVPEPEFARVRGVYETTIATASFADPAAVAAARGALVKAGVALFAGFTPADYSAALDSQVRWYRLFKPAPGGADMDATELGYRGLKFFKGQRGEINPEKPRNRWTSADEQEGYMVFLQARVLDGADTIDTVARCFMTPDRHEEAWSVRMIKADKRAKELGRWTETGARVADDLNVAVNGPGNDDRPIRPFIQGEGYLSQVESYLLPSLLLRAATKNRIQGDFGFYTYRSDSEAISLRRDTLARDPAAGGTWTIATRFHEDSTPQRSTFTDKGDLIRTDLGDGRFWEPTDLKTLLALWQKKGLPIKAGR